MIKVSILVPIYNVEKYIKRCVISLMEQTYENIEYIFVNDCSTDKSLQILENTILDYPKRKDYIKIIHHKKNLGLACARNTALKTSSGEYIFHVDSDDWISKDCITLLIQNANETNADIIDGAYINVFNNKTNIIYPFIKNKERYLKLMLGGYGTISNQIWGRLIKRTLYFEHNILAIKGVNYGEDYTVITRLLYYAKRSTINKPIYYYNHINENSYTKDLNSKNFSSLMNAKIFIRNFYYSQTDYNKYSKYITFGLINIYKYGINKRFNIADLESIIKKTKKPKILEIYFYLIQSRQLILANILFKVIKINL